MDSWEVKMEDGMTGDRWNGFFGIFRRGEDVFQEKMPDGGVVARRGRDAK